MDITTLPTGNGQYVVFFANGNMITWHSFDLINGTWWDGSEIAEDEFVLSVVNQGTSFQRATSWEYV